jgi:asparagine synthetase B (glutamine-hydrolysing)
MEDRDLLFICNGEIYNFKELTETYKLEEYEISPNTSI